MPVAMQCPTCGKKLRAPDGAAGKKVKCPCGAKLIVPEPVAVEAGDEGLVSLDRLADGAPMAGAATCPECRAVLPDGAVLCTQCGFLLSGGKQLSTNFDEAGNPPAYQPPRGGAPKAETPAKARRGRDPDAAPFNWKALIVVVLLVGVGISGYRWYRVLKDFDPQKAAQQKLASIKPGMALAQVVTNMGEPQEVYRFGTGQDHDKDLGFGPLKAHWSMNFLNEYNGRLSNGFYLLYRFTAGGAWEVHFDDKGIMESVEEAPNLFKG